jgi:hypothetical protein
MHIGIGSTGTRCTGLLFNNGKDERFDVAFYRTDGGSALENISLSFSTAPAQDSIYAANARVPTANWASGLHCRKYFSDVDSRQFDAAVDVAIIDAPGELTRLLNASGNYSQPYPNTRSMEPLERWLRDYSSRSEFIIHKIREVAPNLITTTTDENGSYLGLHLDNWDRLPLSDRRAARNRMCLNLGPGPRFLLVVPVSIANLVSRFPHNNLLQHRSAVDLVFSDCPEVPVVRLRVEPGQAYIAATENVLHDASSFEITQPCKILTVRGHFDQITK